MDKKKKIQTGLSQSWSEVCLKFWNIFYSKQFMLKFSSDLTMHSTLNFHLRTNNITINFCRHFPQNSILFTNYEHSQNQQTNIYFTYNCKSSLQTANLHYLFALQWTSNTFCFSRKCQPLLTLQAHIEYSIHQQHKVFSCTWRKHSQNTFFFSFMRLTQLWISV